MILLLGFSINARTMITSQKLFYRLTLRVE